MVGPRRFIASCALALSMSGCTVFGLGAGALVASSKNGDPAVQMGQKPRASAPKHMAVGALIGLALDVAIVAWSINESGGPGH